MQRARIERGMGTGGPTSVRERRIAGEMGRENQMGAMSREADRDAARRRMQPQGVAGAAGNAVWDGTKWVMRGNQEAASGAGGTVTIDAEGRVTQTAAPVKAEGADERVDSVTGMKLPDVVKAHARAKYGNKDNEMYRVMMAGAKTDEQRKAIETQYGPDQAQATYWADVLRRLGYDPDKTAPGTGAAVPAAAGAPAASGQAASGIDRFRRR
jgi:hypothetical protein